MVWQAPEGGPGQAAGSTAVAAGLSSAPSNGQVERHEASDMLVVLEDLIPSQSHSPARSPLHSAQRSTGRHSSAGDPGNHAALLQTQSDRRESAVSEACLSPDSLIAREPTDEDLEDPTLELFPDTKAAILHRIQSLKAEIPVDDCSHIGQDPAESRNDGERSEDPY